MNPAPTPETHTPDLPIFLIAHAAQIRAIKNLRRRLHKKNLPPRHSTAKRSEKQSIGDHFEVLACKHLQQAGLTLIARQLSCPGGEIDLVLREQDLLVFVEVRARNHASHGGAAASVTSRKQTKLIRAAKWHLSSLTERFFAGREPLCRIDVMSFEQGHMQWLRDAIRLEQDK